MNFIITKKDLTDMFLETEHGIFTPLYQYETFDIETETYQGFKVVKTAEEVYNEWLENKDKPIDTRLTTDQMLTKLIIESL